MGGMPSFEVSIDCNVPYRTGYQVILGVWTIYDTGNAFYQVIDANMKPWLFFTNLLNIVIILFNKIVIFLEVS